MARSNKNFNKNTVPSTPDHIKKLEDEIQMLSNETDGFRTWTNTLEEKIEILLVDLTSLSGKLEKEKQITNRLRAENEDVHESSAVSINKIQILEEALLTSKNEILQLQNEKQNYETKLAESKRAAIRAIDELQSQLRLRDRDNNKLKEENNNRKAELKMLAEGHKNCNRSSKSVTRNQKNCVATDVNQDVVVYSGNLLNRDDSIGEFSHQSSFKKSITKDQEPYKWVNGDFFREILEYFVLCCFAVAIFVIVNIVMTMLPL